MQIYMSRIIDGIYEECSYGFLLPTVYCEGGRVPKNYLCSRSRLPETEWVREEEVTTRIQDSFVGAGIYCVGRIIEICKLKRIKSIVIHDFSPYLREVVNGKDISLSDGIRKIVDKYRSDPLSAGIGYQYANTWGIAKDSSRKEELYYYEFCERLARDFATYSD